MEKIKATLITLLVNFIAIVLFFVLQFEKRWQFMILAVLGLLFLVFGIILLVLSRKEKGKYKLFLSLTGYSAIAPFLFENFTGLICLKNVVFLIISEIFNF
ncbi:MAG: hypothetical protein MAG795_01149 [Candidatus Woesearchaeota archaeon]|nr:hypothetical protein [Candidatus Woesearchaeota archaeon]